MRVAITGASGLVGSALTTFLRARGDEVVPVRRGHHPGALSWTPIPEDGAAGFDPPSGLSNFDAVVHLAGENVGDGRWTAAKRARIEQSRVMGTRTVVRALTDADPRPRVLVSATAVGYYGDRGEEELREDAEPGEDFLARVCVQWEAEAQKASALGVRVVRPRLGLVMSPEGGPLARMLPIFRMGVGGKLASGNHWMSWIHLHDTVRALVRCLDDDALEGPVNVVAPHPVRNAEFTKTLATALRRPAFFPVPRLALKAVLGDMGDVALMSQRAVPGALAAAGFEFEHPDLGPAFQDLLG